MCIESQGRPLLQSGKTCFWWCILHYWLCLCVSGYLWRQAKGWPADVSFGSAPHAHFNWQAWMSMSNVFNQSYLEQTKRLPPWKCRDWSLIPKRKCFVSAAFCKKKKKLPRQEQSVFTRASSVKSPAQDVWRWGPELNNFWLSAFFKKKQHRPLF